MGEKCPECGNYDVRREYTDCHADEVEVVYSCMDGECGVASFVDKFHRYDKEVVMRL